MSKALAEQFGTTGAEVREAIRAGRYDGDTSGLAPGYVQGNVVILPGELAHHFLAYCQRNPKPCPLLAMSEPGDPSLPQLGEVDIRTDVPKYRVFRDGEFVEEVTDIRHLWRDDFVTFILGCSYSFEEALLEEGIPLRHIEQGTSVPMYETNLPTEPAGPFAGNMVVSMRPLKAADAIRAIQITSRYPAVHGAPVHLGDPALIGIEDVDAPDYGDRSEVRPGEIPVFWACGVTPQVAIQRAKPSISITHKPGHMLVTDLRNRQLAIL